MAMPPWVNKGRAEGQHYRQLGLLQAGCPTAESIYVRASPLQRTRATAQALVDGAFPGCGVAIHYVSGDADPLFQTDKFAATQTDPARQLAAVKEKAGGSGAASAGAGADHPAIETGGLSGR